MPAPQVEVLRAGVEAGEDAGVAGVLDPVALDHHVARAALEVQAGGGGVVDVAVLDHHAVAVDVVDAVGVAVVATAGVADLDPADDGAVGLGRDLDAVAAGVAEATDSRTGQGDVQRGVPLLEEHPRLHTIQGTVARLLLDGEGGRVIGVETLEGRRFGAKAVVITTSEAPVPDDGSPCSQLVCSMIP